MVKVEYRLPFRWNLARRNELGRLVSGEFARDYEAFYPQLLSCCAKVISLSGDSSLVFVGRSPESIFDHLSGLLFDTSWSERLRLLHFSMRFQDEANVRKDYPNAINSMRSHFDQLKLDPLSISTSPSPITFVDLVATGDTFGRLIRFLQSWTLEAKFDWSAVVRRICIVGITEQKKTSPNTWRWHQHAEWTSMLKKNSIKNVSIPRELWDFLGNYQEKVTPSHKPSRWGSDESASPSRSQENLKGLRMALKLFDLGRNEETRERFASHLVTEKTMNQSWFRNLVAEIR